MILFRDPDCFLYFADVVMLCGTHGAVGKHGDSGLFSGQALKGNSGGSGNLRQLFAGRVLVQSAVREYKGSVLTVLAVRHIHKEECGYKLGSRSGLQDLQAGTKGVGRAVACAGYKTVRVLHLDHHNAVINILVQEDILRLLGSHPLLLSELHQLVDICRKLVAGRRIDHGRFADINAILGSFTVYVIHIADDHDIRNIFRKHSRSGAVGSLVFGLGKYDHLLVCFCFCLNLINECHNE